MTRLRIFLADDHPVVLSGLRNFIGSQADMEVVGEATDGVSAVQQVGELSPDVAVIDISMPLLSGAQVTRQLQRRHPAVKVLALSVHEDKGYVQQMLGAGASGYLIKRAAAEELVRVIRLVADGQIYIDPSVARLLVTELVGPARALAPALELSERESAVLHRMARGHAVKQIAVELSVGARTVETYRARAMEKLGLKNRADIVGYAVRQGWLDGA